MGKEKEKRKQRPEDASLEEVMEAMDVMSKWITKKLYGRTERGALSEAALGEPAVMYFSKMAYIKWASGEWVWPEGISLTTILIRIARSDISHHVKAWLRQGGPEVSAMSDQQTALDVARELAQDLEAEEELKALGYQMAEARVKDNPTYLKYIKAVRELNNYKAIAKRMKMSISAVKALEAELLATLREQI